MRDGSSRFSRRCFLRSGARAFGALGLVLGGGTAGVPVVRAAGADDFGPLQPPDGNGLMLPSGFSSRIVAVSNSTVGTTSHTWHFSPDGGAVFAAPGNGWVYVSNAERGDGNSGVGAIRFAADGSIVDAYSILTGSYRNCAGGPTPWGTWLSCEEVVAGRVFECSPLSPGSEGTERSALGYFNHEAAAVDPLHGTIYLTEDKADGRLYRFTPSSYPDLTAGVLEVAEILDPLPEGPIQPGQVRSLSWHALLDPNPSGGGVQSNVHFPVEQRATRFQVAASTAFLGGEGCWYADGLVYFSTKHDERIWKIDTAANQISIYYQRSVSPTPELTNVDNVYVSPAGDVYVAEDPGDLQIVALTPSGAVKPIVQVTGVTGSEITGPALSPDGSRLYFSSQRNPGRTFEVTGPFTSGLGIVPALGELGSGLMMGALYAAYRLRRRVRG